MKSIQVKCPAKINIDLKVLDKREDGFHNIESIMQTINLFDYLTIEVKPAQQTEIVLSGNSDEIPYNEANLVYKAAKLFLDKINSLCTVNIYIDKHIPVCAGLAGGSSDAAGTLYGLNELFNSPLTIDELHLLCAKLGSDLNVCLQGGRILAKGRGEILKTLPYEEFNLSVIKPDNVGISAKEAYTKFSAKDLNDKSRKNFSNDLEWAVINDYPQLQKIKTKYPNALMTGSGSAYYIVNTEIKPIEGYTVLNNLITIPYGVKKY
ncbi:4-(cytidine 5'-diphospho)-2-C-methyl-D-erythritol kinase [bacterium]|nr:4-(cytidine 5'-diphospho)-2-C-methyl-D-erythritol kinase [bacterium]